MTVSIIIVSYNTKTLLEACLSSIVSNQSEQVEVIVVDNGSSDGSQKRIKSKFPEVHLIENSDNVGYAAANNQGIAKAKGELLWLLNSDTVLPPEAIKAMIAAMNQNPAIGIGSPRLVYPDGRPQSNGGGLPTWWRIFTWMFFLDLLPFSKLWQPYHFRARPHTQLQLQGWVSGAAWCIRRRCLNTIGPLDEGTFMYTEDVEWCYRAYKAGFGVAEFGTFSVIHHGQGSGSHLSALKAEMVHLPKVIKAHNQNPKLSLWLFTLGRRFRHLMFARILNNDQRGQVYA